MKTLKLALGIVLASAAVLSAQEVVTPQFEVGPTIPGCTSSPLKGSTTGSGRETAARGLSSTT
jgi:hypothetical protein